MTWLKRGLIFLCLLGLVVYGAGYWFYQAIAPTRDSQVKSVLYRVEPGATLNGIIQDLEKKNLIRNPYPVVIMAKVFGWDSQVKVGYFRLSSEMNAFDLLDKLVHGQAEQLSYTIPEGYRIDQASKKLGQFELSPQKYIEIAENIPSDLKETYPFVRELKTLEGYLFPDTYFLSGSEKQLISSQLKRFQEVVLPLWEQRPAQHKLNFYDTIKLASIVELEGLLDHELPRIAGVFLSRLRIGMRLGSDPTVEYALGWHQGAKGLSLKDVQIKSPYNTYLNTGLPPTPIGNPGVAAIKAVLYPEKTPYLFFVAKGDGSHIFSKTYEQHLAAIRRIQKGNI